MASEDLSVSKESTKIKRYQFYFESPLYDVIDLMHVEEDVFKGEVDAWSATNNIDTTYEISAARVSDWSGSICYDIWIVTLKCKRKGEELLFFIYIPEDRSKCVKIGQIPSLASLQFSNLDRKYKSVLDRENIKLFKKAVGLVSHGAGAGSFVYLRRIFEGLIQESFTTHKDDLSVPEKTFNEQRMADKVSTLKAYLPHPLVEMKGLYGVLSQGVHELTEEECLSYFPVLKLAIELILDQKIEDDIKKKRDEEVKKQLRQISSKLGSKK